MLPNLSTIFWRMPFLEGIEFPYYWLATSKVDFLELRLMYIYIVIRYANS